MPEKGRTMWDLKYMKLISSMLPSLPMILLRSGSAEDKTSMKPQFSISCGSEVWRRLGQTFRMKGML